MIHVLNAMVTQAVLAKEEIPSPEIPEGDPIPKNNGFYLFNIGPRQSKRDILSIKDLQTFSNNIQVPVLFKQMLQAASFEEKHEIAAFAITDHPRERFYLVGLFEEKEKFGSRVFSPIKAVEVSGLDEFVRTTESSLLTV
jgi:hypothetical protein